MLFTCGDGLRNRRRHVAVWSLLVLAALSLPSPLRAQQQGPITPPPVAPPLTIPVPAGQPSKPQPASKPQNQGKPQQVSYPITHEPPSTPVDQIIQHFAAHEAEFRTAINGYTYRKTVIVQTIDSEGDVDGEYRMTTDITYSPSGQRYEKVTDAPVPTLTRISLSPEDLADLRNIQPFVLTTSELPKYNVTYVGRQRVDYVHTYVFDVAPKKIEKHQRYFQGRVWVDVHDLAIVKTDGKAVPDIRKGSEENLFPSFTSYRENIKGTYWFPVYTYADDVLHFGLGYGGDVHVQMIIRWTDYKRFRVSVKVVGSPQPHP